MNEPEFKEFQKIFRLSRECIITEKIDGTNAQVCITDGGRVIAGSRSRWITPQDDNYGFARWVEENQSELLKLGPGNHFGEWWGNGCQRGYGLPKGEKRFSLFNVRRWCLFGSDPARIETEDPMVEKYQEILPACCGLVPKLFRGPFTTENCESALLHLAQYGSQAAPGFLNPEGVVIFHIPSGYLFKKTIHKDEAPKSRK